MATGWLHTGQKREGGVTAVVLWLWKLRLKEVMSSAYSHMASEPCTENWAQHGSDALPKVLRECQGL